MATLKQLEERIAALEGRRNNPGMSARAEVTLEKHLETRLSEQREFFNSRIAAQQEYFVSKIAALDTAINVATAALDKRLEGMNEFRDTLKDQAGRLATRDELSSEARRINKDISDLKKSRDETAGKASQTSVLIALAVSLIGLVMGLVNLLGG